jgi:hypothetical protein
MALWLISLVIGMVASGYEWRGVGIYFNGLSLAFAVSAMIVSLVK